MELMERLKEFIQKNKETLLKDYFSFLRFQSIGADPAYEEETAKCARWLKDYLEGKGISSTLLKTSKQDVVFGERRSKKGGKTILLYGHYDVQPVDPIDEWKTPPFEPVLKDGTIYARGAQDNKGQIFYVISAIAALIELQEQIPLNIKILIEGGEESGSLGLFEILEKEKERFQTDYLVVADVGIKDKATPTLTLGARGIIVMEVEVTGPSYDLHSGSFGGMVVNPCLALTKILSSLQDEKGAVLIEGFYDDVIELSEETRAKLDTSFDEKGFEKQFGVKPIGGEASYSPKERASIRPTLEINGIFGGVDQNSFKTIIPKKAGAKLSARLVDGQSPEKTFALIKKAVEGHKIEGVTIKCTPYEGRGGAAVCKPDSKVLSAYQSAYQEVFLKECVYTYEGGSIPIAANLQKSLEAELLFMGLGLDTDLIHAPNENFSWDRFEKGFLITALALTKGFC